MPFQLHRLPLTGQTAAHLRENIQSGRWVGQLPGVIQLAGELRVSNHTVRAALKLLEEEGWIEDCGAGRRRRILLQRNATPALRPLRIGIMLCTPIAREDALTTAFLLDIRHAIETAGHLCIFSKYCLEQMKENLTKISRCVKSANADAWIVITGSRVVLEWFAAQSFPVFAYGGHFQNLPVASTASRLAPAIESTVNALVDQGHRRIVLLAATHLRQPTPIPSLESYLSYLEARGIPATDYNLPHFDDTVEGLESCLDRLFRITPPTALIVPHAPHFAAVFFFLARCGLRVPRDVSVVCMFPDPVFNMCLPPIDHFEVPQEKPVAAVARWVDGVAKGRPHNRQMTYDAVYVPGGTMGPAMK